ncbi:MAG: phage major capsid protein [Proteobacteria bacterium]|nr:phage major capsid protein [Pseudomonadota bacterium]
MPPHSSIFRITLVGLVSLALAMGIGRFAFTPLLPMMREDGLVSITDGGLLASVHFLGYWLGAVLAVKIPYAPRTTLRVSLLAIGVGTLGMGVTDDFTVWLILRWLSGVCSAWTLVLVSNYYIRHLAEKGGAEYQGVLNSPARIEVAKESGQAADTINSTNVIKMRSRCWGYNRSIWLANHDTFEQIAVLALAVGTGGSTSLYQPSNREESPDFLAGRPMFYSEHCSTLGSAGDLILANWGEYLEGTYQPFTGASSVHVRFVTHESVLKFWIRNDGAPWWRSALTPANGTATLSPIVTLAART